MTGDTELSDYTMPDVCLDHQFLAQQSVFLLVHNKQEARLRRKESVESYAGG